MEDIDYRAMCELALELTYGEAAKFIRSESKGTLGLRDSARIIERLAEENPNTTLGQSFSKILLSREG